MPYNGSGTWAAPASTFNPAVTNTSINSTDWTALLADVSTALSTCMLKDGQQTPTANIPMGGFKFTGLAAGSATGNSLRYEQLFPAYNETKTTVASAATPDIWTSVGNVVDYTGAVTATGFAAAPQAGSRRSLICAGAAPFTAGANMLIDGYAAASTFTAAAGDVVDVIAVTTTQFRLKPRPTNGSEFASGTRMLFQQTTAPTGWTKEVSATYNDAAMRITTGTVSTGGATAFTSVFGAGKTTGSYTLANADVPSHTHVYRWGSGAGASTSPDTNTGSASNNDLAGNTDSSGGGGSHTHTLSLNLSYADCIIASKN